MPEIQKPTPFHILNTHLATRFPEHAQVLELHHRIPLGRGAQRPKGTEAFALLCPTCHRVVQYRREEPLDVDVLKARLHP